jgi:hypothetical protein
LHHETLFIPPRPNPRRVAIFLAEKGVTDLPQVMVSIANNEHKGQAYRASSPLAKVPPLVLDGGRVLTDYEVFPLVCPMCGRQMRIIAFITFSADIHRIFKHIGVEPELPRIAPPRGPPLWDDCGANEVGEGVEALPDWDLANQSPPDYFDDQRTTW